MQTMSINAAGLSDTRPRIQLSTRSLRAAVRRRTFAAVTASTATLRLAAGCMLAAAALVVALVSDSDRLTAITATASIMTFVPELVAMSFINPAKGGES